MFDDHEDRRNPFIILSELGFDRDPRRKVPMQAVELELRTNGEVLETFSVMVSEASVKLFVGSIMGVVADWGRHEIEMRYRRAGR